ncbi:MAG: NrdH-redoxin [Chloroflexi bacterium]|nr:NrdH-redoxin [Chloroflexota bacterium]|tara:strand:+ start:1971 stop:2222 length:252 start_codon:yes stop_codon:yes gene_type:complete
MNNSDIKFYTATWCGYCQSLKAFMDRNEINYSSFDIDENPDKIDDLYKYQNGGRTIPMLVYSDDDHQVNPKPNDVLKKIQSLN